MTTCLYCIHENKEDFNSYNDCILGALEKIKNHYLYVKNEVSEKERQLKQLQQRNEKLTKAVELLQQQKLQESISALDYRSPQKRRKINIRTSRDDLSFSDEATGQAPGVVDLTADELNMALNSQQIFDCSSADTSPSRNESIGETETINSPRILRTTFEERREFPARRNLLDSSGNNENRKPLTPVKVNKDAWVGKEKPDSGKSPKGRNIAWNGSFLKPHAVEGMKIERKTSLSLKKSAKMKQTRLQVVPDKSFSELDSTYCEDAIDASPNTSKSNKMKSSRTLLLRNSSIGNASRKASPKDPHDLTFDLREEDENTDNPSVDTHDIPSSSRNSVRNNESSDLSNKNLELKVSDSHEKMNSNESKNCDADSSSVMILTPATQDIIFLDDSYNQSMIESMDLLEALMKCGDQSLENLKRVESEKIKQLQRTASAAPRLEGLNKLYTEAKPVKSVPGSSTTKPPVKAIESTAVKIKQEKTTQKPIEKDSKKTEQEESSDDDFIPLPIIVKKEQTETSDGDKNNGGKRKGINIKDKFGIECKDCQRYIDVLGDRMSDEDIMERLKSCMRHKEVEINQTPDGFWDPFIPTFDENDPRNETLVDTRFRGRKT